MTSITTDSSATTPASAGVVVNRHIPKDWQKGYVVPSSNRKPSLCGTRTAGKYQGIPGVTLQPLGIDDRPGWCVGCIDSLFNFYREELDAVVTIPEVRAVYDIVFFEMLRFMRYCIDNAERLGISLENNGQNLTQ